MTWRTRFISLFVAAAALLGLALSAGANWYD